LTNLFHEPIPVWVVGHDAGRPENARTPQLFPGENFDPDCDLLTFSQAQSSVSSMVLQRLHPP
jgi:hypothetical protein